MLCLFGALFMVSPAKSATDDVLTIVGSEAPPFIVKEGDKISGFIPDLLREAASRARIKYELKLVPWARAYKMAKKGPGVALMMMARTEHREDELQWVYPLFRAETMFIRLKSGNTQRDIDKNETSICALARSAMVGHLKRKGYRRIIKAPDIHSCAELLGNKKVDVIFGGWFTTVHAFRTLNLPVDDLAKDETVLSIDIYLTASKDVPAQRIKNLQRIIHQMTTDGTYGVFLSQYKLQGLPRPKVKATSTN
jgi:polar amino acid transport system substrate-binding protein